MGAAEVDVALRDGGHAELVERSGEERREGAGENHVAVPHGTTDRHTHLRAGEEERKTAEERWKQVNEEEERGGEEQRAKCRCRFSVIQAEVILSALAEALKCNVLELKPLRPLHCCIDSVSAALQ